MACLAVKVLDCCVALQASTFYACMEQSALNSSASWFCFPACLCSIKQTGFVSVRHATSCFLDPVLAKCADTDQHSKGGKVVHLLDLQSCGGFACPGAGRPWGGCRPALLCPQHAADLLLTSSSHPASPLACPCSSHASFEGRNRFKKLTIMQ